MDILDESTMALFVEGLVRSCSDFGQRLRHNLDQLIELSGNADNPRKDRVLAATAQLLWCQMEQIVVLLPDAQNC